MKTNIETKQSNSYGWCQSWIDDDGNRTQFYSDHYSKIRKAKNMEERGSGIVSDHELAPSIGKGKKIIFDSGRTYFVDSVYKHWNKGFYLYVLYYTITDKGNLSHGGLFYENVNSHCPFIEQYISENEGFTISESTIQEKIDIIIENRKKSNLSLIVFVDKVDSFDGVFELSDNIEENEKVIKNHIDNNTPLVITGNLLNIKSDRGFDFVQIEYLSNDMHNDLVLFTRRNA